MSFKFCGNFDDLSIENISCLKTIAHQKSPSINQNSEQSHTLTLEFKDKSAYKAFVEHAYMTKDYYEIVEKK